MASHSVQWLIAGCTSVTERHNRQMDHALLLSEITPNDKDNGARVHTKLARHIIRHIVDECPVTELSGRVC